MWSDADSRRHQSVTPQAVGDALAKIHFTHAAPAASPASHMSDLMLAGVTAGVGVDLVSLGIRAISRLFDDT
jgi:hypothetical protein